jgi:hypothetical protein
MDYDRLTYTWVGINGSNNSVGFIYVGTRLQTLKYLKGAPEKVVDDIFNVDIMAKRVSFPVTNKGLTTNIFDKNNKLIYTLHVLPHMFIDVNTDPNNNKNVGGGGRRSSRSSRKRNTLRRRRN